MISLHPHQTDLMNRVRACFPEHRSILMYAPPGAGKTVIAAAIARGAHEKRRRVIFACHRTQLLTQTAGTFDRFSIPYGFIASGWPANPYALVQIASIDTLRNRYERYATDTLVVDEAHLSGARTWTEIIDYYRASGAMVIGLSGSPCRLDGKPLRANFSHMVEGPQPDWLIKNKYLSEYVPIAAKRMDLKGLHTRAGEYVTAELSEKFDKPSVVGNAVSAWKDFARGKRTVAYCFSIEHSKHVAETYRVNGVNAEHMDGTASHDERKRIIHQFADGIIEIITNVELLTTGFDLSAQVGREVPIEAVSLQRPSQSLALAIQMMMRALRYKPEPAILLDHACLMMNADGTMNHGFPSDEREWSLDGMPINKNSGEALIPTCVCKKCFAMFRPAPVCPYCGYERETEGRDVEQVDGTMYAVDIEQARLANIEAKRKAEFEAREKTRRTNAARTVKELVAVARENNYKLPGFVAQKLKGRGQFTATTMSEIYREMRS
jgi:DNA repair protein RadD